VTNSASDAATMGVVDARTPQRFRLGCPTPQFWSTL